MVFDAVGTVIKPVPGVLEIYHETGRQYGSQLSLDSIADRFREGRTDFFRRNSDFKSSDEIERELWRRLVTFVFEDLSNTADLFEELWSRFASPQSWSVFDDVNACLSALDSVGATVAVGSNFDSRLLAICDEIFGSETFDFVFCSSLVGYRKPAKQFYEHIELRYPNKHIVMVGDDEENDVRGPKSLGWESLLIDRKNQSGDSISSLVQLPAKIAER